MVASASARAAGSGYVNAATRTPGARSGAGIPSALTTTASTGFAAPSAAEATAAATSSAVATTGGTKRTITLSIAGSARTSGSAAS